MHYDHVWAMLAVIQDPTGGQESRQGRVVGVWTAKELQLVDCRNRHDAS